MINFPLHIHPEPCLSFRVTWTSVPLLPNNPIFKSKSILLEFSYYSRILFDARDVGVNKTESLKNRMVTQKRQISKQICGL